MILSKEEQSNLLAWMPLLAEGMDVHSEAKKKVWKTFEANKEIKRSRITTKFHFRLTKAGELEIDLISFRKENLDEVKKPSKLLNLLTAMAAVR